MKTVKLFGTTALACLFVVACAKSNETPASLAKGKGDKTTQGTGNSTDGTISERGTREPLKLDLNTTTYTGQSVVLAAKDAKNTGLIRIVSNDAKALMERLRIKEEDISKSQDKKMIAKTGKAVQCINYESQGENACYIYIDYRTGNLLAERTDVQTDDQAKEVTELYSSTNSGELPKALAILEGGKGVITIEGQDAEALYQTLSVEAKDAGLGDSWLVIKEKLGGNIRCTQEVANNQTSQTKFSCVITLNSADGSVNAATTGAVSKAEEKKEETKSDDNSGGTTTPETPETPATTVDPVTGAAK